MLMNEGLTPEIYSFQKLRLTQNMTAGELHDKLSLLGADVLSKTIRALLDDSLKPIKNKTMMRLLFAYAYQRRFCPIDFTKTIDTKITQ